MLHPLQYIDKIQTSVEINGENINFSQAAMMLQGKNKNLFLAT